MVTIDAIWKPMFYTKCQTDLKFLYIPVMKTSGVARSLVLAGHLLYTSSRESNNTSARARFA